MGRSCQYPGCTTKLASCVPFDITLCGMHQYRLLKLREKLAEENLPEEDIQFIFYNPKGCNINQLAIRSGIHRSTLLGHLKRRVVKGRKRENSRQWQIPQEEIIRVIVLTRNWITVWRIARSVGIDRGTLFGYVQAGYFGPYQVHLCSGLAIRKKEIAGLLKKYERTKRERQLNKRGWFRRYLKEDEITVVQISRLLLTTREAVYYHIKKRWLSCEKRKRIFVIKKGDFISFSQKAIKGEYPLSPRTKERLRAFLANYS